MLAHCLMVVGILAISIALYPRNDGLNIYRTLGIGVGFLVLSGLSLGFFVIGQNANLLQQNVFRTAHESKQTLPRPDMQSVTGTLEIQPGDNITMTLDIRVQAPQEHGLSHSAIHAQSRIDGTSCSCCRREYRVATCTGDA